MKTAALLLSGILLGYFLARRRAIRVDVHLETDELATPTLFRRTVKLQLRPVPEGVAQGPA